MPASGHAASTTRRGDAERPPGRVYSALTHYFKAVAAAGSDRSAAVVAKMREIPIRDPIVR